MKNRLFIWAGCQPETDLRWLLWDVKAGVLVEQGSVPVAELVSLGTQAKSAEVILLLPGEQVVCHQIALPNRSRMARRSVAFALEEQLSQPLDELHLAEGKLAADLSLPVLVVAREYLSDWLDKLATAGLKADRVTADYLCLPADGASCLLNDNGRVLARSGQRGATLAASWFSVGWPMPEDDAMVTCFGEVPPGIEVNQQALPDTGALAHLASGFKAGAVIELQQGAFARSNGFVDSLNRLRWPAAAVLLMALIQSASLALENARLEQQIVAYDQEIKRVFQTAVPEARRVVNPRAQMRARLQAQSQLGDDLLSPIMQALAEPLKRSGSALQSLRFDARSGEVKLLITAPDYAAVEKLRNDIQQGGEYQVTPGTFRHTDKGVSAQLRIGGLQ